MGDRSGLLDTDPPAQILRVGTLGYDRGDRTIGASGGRSGRAVRSTVMRAPIWVRRWCCALTVVLASCGEGTSGVAKAILATGSSSSPTSPMSESSSTATAARAEPTATGAFASTTATQVVSRPPCVVGSVTFNVPVGWSYLVEPAPSAPKPSPPYACGWLVPTEANGRAAFPETFGFDFIDSSRFGNGIDAVLQSILPKVTVG